MRLRIIVFTWIISFLIINCLGAQEFFDSKWKFKIGDNAEWAKPEFDDSDWAEIKINDLWENQGYANYNGFAWYRVQFIIPEKYKKLVEKNDGLVLRLGKVDDVDYTYLNGELVGQTGSLPPNYITKYQEARVYSLPLAKIIWGKPNTLAVRVYDAQGGGGLYEGPVYLSLKKLADSFTIRVEMNQDDNILIKQKKLSLPIKIENKSDETVSGELSWEVVSDVKEPVLAKKEPLKMAKNSRKEIKLKLDELQPGFYEIKIQFKSLLNNRESTIKFGVDPEKMAAPLSRQPDFEDYWRRAKKELAAVEPQYKMTKIDSLCTETKEMYLVEMRSQGNVLIRGWYGKPVKPGKYPAILHVQGYSSVMRPQWVNSGDEFVDLGLNIRGHGNSCDNVNPGFPGYLLYQLHDKDTYIYRGSYMDCVRAVDFLCTRPEVDQAQIVVEGTSQGGALSFATAALNNDRIRLCVPSVPFLSDFPDYFKVAPWPGNEFTQYEQEHPEISWDDIFYTLSYIDIKNLAPWIKAPVLMTVGLVDVTCPPHINFAAYNNLSVPKEYKVYPGAGHSLPGSSWNFRMNWIKKELGMK